MTFVKYLIILLFLFLSHILFAETWFSEWSVPQFSDKQTWQNGDWRLRTSLYTVHYNPTTEHNNRQKLINLEYIRQDDWLIGAAFFHNSFAQPTQYIYLGHDWWLWRDENWRVRATLTGGLLHGYKGQYADKIPFNNFGIAPALLPSVGLVYKQSWFMEAQFFATAGVMATVGYRF